MTGASDDDGRFEVRLATPGDLRVIVSDTAHEPCVRDFAAAELGGAEPDRMALLQPRPRPRRQRDPRAHPPRPPRGDPADADEDRADHRPRDDRRPAAGAAEHARRRARAVRPRPADRARRQPGRHGRVHRRRADPGPLPLPGRAVGVHRQPHRQDRLLPGRVRRPLRPLHRRRRRRRHQGRRGPLAARRGRHQPARFVGVRRRSGAGRRCAPASPFAAATSTRSCRSILPYFVPQRAGLDVLHGRARVLGLPGAGRQGPAPAAAARRCSPTAAAIRWS